MDVLAVGTSMLGAVGRASLQGALAVAAVWIVCRLFPRLPASLRCGLWWLACAKLVFGLGWSLAGAAPVRLAVLPATEQAQPSPPWPPSPTRTPAARERGEEDAQRALSPVFSGVVAPLSRAAGVRVGEGTGVRVHRNPIP
jgi:hypothetical protein